MPAGEPGGTELLLVAEDLSGSASAFGELELVFAPGVPEGAEPTGGTVPFAVPIPDEPLTCDELAAAGEEARGDDAAPSALLELDPGLAGDELG